jgi:MOSC domain-containing protein YiiM
LPGLRLRLGDDVRIELTAFASPCQTIAGNFCDRNFNRINERVAPRSSRVYAKVLTEGRIRPGDAIVVEGLAEPTYGPADPEIDGIGQVAVRVASLERSLAY